MLESQQLFFGEQLLSRIFEEYQQTAIQTKIVSCPQNWEHGLKKANRYPNLKRGAPAVFMKLNMRFKFAEIQTMCLFRELKIASTVCKNKKNIESIHRRKNSVSKSQKTRLQLTEKL
jgi:hypothetical protein